MAKKSADPAKKYNSNPFTLAFDSLGRLFKTNLIWAIIILILSAGGLYSYTLSNSSDSNNKDTQTVVKKNNGTSSVEVKDSAKAKSVQPAEAGLILSASLVALTASIIVGTFLTGGFSYVVLQSEKGRSVSFSETFKETRIRFWRLLWAQLLAGIKILAWSLLLIIPGIIASLKYSLLPYLIMDESAKEKGIVDAHDKTKKIIKGRVWESFGISASLSIIPIFSGILMVTGRGALYRQLQYSYQSKVKRPKIHWLNYLGIILLLLSVLLITGIIALAVVLLHS